MAKAKKSVLGRGLGNLLDTSPETTALKRSEGIEDIPLNKIRTNPDNPRKKFDKTAIDELARTIKEHGLLQPILVTAEKDHYRVVSGERRLRACRSLKQKSIPCIVKEFSNRQTHEVSLIENIQREQLDAIEEAMAYKTILDSHQLTQEQLAEKVGKNRATIANRVRLLNLPLNIQTMIADGKLTEGQVRPLLTIKDESAQSRFAERIVKDQLNARQVEDLVRSGGRSTGKASSAKKKAKRSKHAADIRTLEERLERKLKTRVQLNHNDKKEAGKLTIEYFNLDDLDRVLSALGVRNLIK